MRHWQSFDAHTMGCVITRMAKRSTMELPVAVAVAIAVAVADYMQLGVAVLVGVLHMHLVVQVLQLIGCKGDAMEHDIISRVTHKVDVWSLGVCIFELVAGMFECW